MILSFTTNKVRIIFFTLICLLSNWGTAQGVDLSQFYESKFEPEELNSSSESRIKLLYEEYKIEHTEKTRLDEKQFVYEYNYHLDRLNRSGSIYFGDSIGAYLNELKDFLVEDDYLRQKIKVYLTNFPYLNAFTNDFGNIYVNVATLAMIESEEQLMYMLAHEIGHIVRRHSHSSKEVELKNKRKWNSEEDVNFERHAFSRMNELEADSFALAMLQDRISPDFAIKLIESLNDAANPVFDGAINFETLTGGRSYCSQFLDSIWGGMSTETVFFEMEDDSLSTHPSSKNRKKYLEELLAGKDSSTIIYAPTGKLNEIQRLSRCLLVDSYLESGSYLEALDLSVKMRSNSDQSDDDFFKIRQIKSLMALIQLKTYSDVEDKILNLRGNACNDLDYLRFRKLFLELSPLDFNIIALEAIENLTTPSKKSTAESIASKKSYQFLFKGYPELFTQDSIKEYWQYAAFDAVINDLYDTAYSISGKVKDLTDSETEENEFINELSELGYVTFEPVDTSYLLQPFLASSVIDSTQIKFITSYKSSLKDSVFSISPYELRDVFGIPHATVWRFFRGRFLKSSKFDLMAITALIESDNYYFNSRRKRNYSLDFQKSLALEESMKELYNNYPDYNYDFSNKSRGESNQKLTVFDNYLHRIILTWMDDMSAGEDLVYSPSEDLIKKHVLERGISYLVYRVCIVTRNKGKGKKHYLNYYEIYFDIENDGMAYLTKIASKSAPNKYQLEQLIYLSSENKKENN